MIMSTYTKALKEEIKKLKQEIAELKASIPQLQYDAIMDAVETNEFLSEEFDEIIYSSDMYTYAYKITEQTKVTEPKDL